MASVPPYRPPQSPPQSPGPLGFPSHRLSTERLAELMETLINSVDNINRSFMQHREENVERWVALNQRLDTTDAQIEGIARCLLSNFGVPPPPPPPPPPAGYGTPLMDDDDDDLVSSSEN